MGSLFKKPKAPKVSSMAGASSPPPIDLGPAPGDPGNADANAAMENAAAVERMRRAGKGMASTFVNGAAGVRQESVRVRRAGGVSRAVMV